LEFILNDTRFIQPVPRSELDRRWALAKAIMEMRGLDALIMQNSNDWLGGYVRWFTGVPANNAYPRAVIFYGPGDMMVVEQGPEGGVSQASGQQLALTGVREVRTYPSYTSAYYSVAYDAALVEDMLSERGARQIGWVNPAGAYFGFAKEFERLHGADRFDDVTDEIDLAKSIKSAFERDLIRKTAALQDDVMEEVAGFIKPGMRDFEVAAFAQYEARRRGAEQGIFLGSSSPRGTAAVFRSPHMQGRTIEYGDVFSLLVETNGPGGFYTELGRTFSLGQPESDLVLAAQNAADAQAYSLERLRPGVSSADVAAANDVFMAKLGRPAERRLYCHGQGYDMVERPLIRSNEGMVIQQDMSIVVHPGYITDAVNALVCDNYLIEAEGPSECLHRTSKKIWIV
jgi:Xaa-Pro aminopeptidase